MSFNVNPPPRVRLPQSFIQNNEIRAWSEQIQTIVFQLYNQVSGDNSSLDGVLESITELEQGLLSVQQAIEIINVSLGDLDTAIGLINDEIVIINQRLDDITINNRVIVKSSADLAGTLDSSKEYFIDGIIDMTGVQINVPSGGLNISGLNYDNSGLVCADDNYTLFSGADAGNVGHNRFYIEVSGTNSKVYNLTATDANRAIEITSVNYINCTSLGAMSGYRQLFEAETARFGGTPELTFAGAWNGVKIASSLVRGINNISALFKTGVGLTFSGRFVSNINVDLPTTGALLDFSDANITNDESLIFDDAYITRNGTINPTDATIYPNITSESVKSKWVNNTGLPNTNKYLKAICSTEVETVISAVDTWTELSGTITLNKGVHFDMPANGEYRLLSGYSDYTISGNVVMVGSANDEIEIRANKSTDNGATWNDPLDSVTRVINNLAGSRDIAYFAVSFLDSLGKNDRVRLEVLNKTGSSNVTMEADSYIIIREV